MSNEDLHREILVKLATFEEAIRGLTEKVGYQNGRVGKAEVAINNLVNTDNSLLRDLKDIRDRNERIDQAVTSRQSRNVNMFYSILEKIVWIGLGMVLMNADKVLSFI